MIKLLKEVIEYTKHRFFGGSITIRVNGRNCDILLVDTDDSSDDILNMAMALESVKTFVGSRKFIKFVYVPHKYFNIIVR